MKTKDCNSNDFLLAVYDVYLENEHAEGKGCIKAGAEAWSINSELRRELWERVREKYCERTKCDPLGFWFSEDGCCLAYTRWRKSDQGDRIATAISLLNCLHH